MMLTAWPQVGAPGELKLWVGVFGTEQPPAPRFEVGGQPVLPLAPATLQAIRDRQTGPSGRPLNHQGVYRLAARGPDLPHRVAVLADNGRVERIVHTLPAAVPEQLAGSFNILLASCYFQPGDSGGLLGRIVSQLPVRPHMTLLAGDQVYLDLPLFEDLPQTEPHLSHWLGDKYRRNWLSGPLGIAGLDALLSRAPTVCIPDDHEFWNNYPFAQAQLPGTWREGPRQRWADAARALYEDFQQGGPPGSAPAFWRLDVEPLRVLLLDTRSDRREAFDAADGLMNPAASDALAAWKKDLLEDQRAGRAGIGVLATGQALFVDRPGETAGRWQDAELANYRQSRDIEAALGELAAAGLPTVFLTGDVHWGRVAEALHVPSGRRLLHEVICSPARLIESPGTDQRALLADRLRGLFGKRQTWPRHQEPPDPPARYGSAREFAPRKVFGRRGDQIALVQFTRAGRGLEMRVTYHAIHPDAEISRPETTGPFTLLPY